MKAEWGLSRDVGDGAARTKAQRPQGRGTFRELPGPSLKLGCGEHVEEDGERGSNHVMEDPGLFS